MTAPVELITRNLEEVITRDDLERLVATGTPLKHYIGFEISGKIHLGTGLVCMSKVKDFVDAGVDCTIFLADWHSWINDKLGGDRETIRRIALGYFAEGMKASEEAPSSWVRTRCRRVRVSELRAELIEEKLWR